MALGAALVVLLAFVHLWRLGEVPRGLHVDESGIGVSAAALAASGRDELGVAWPVYFRSFGEWKNPLVIYTAAGLFRLGGPSVWLLRFAGALWAALLVAGLAVLARRLAAHGPPDGVGERDAALWAGLWALAAGGLLPWFFPSTRLCAEVITQPAVVVWALVLVHAAYEGRRRGPDGGSEPAGAERGRLGLAFGPGERRPRGRDFAPGERGRLGLALGAGLLLGLSIYSYSTARLLSPLLALLVLALYAGRRTWRRHLALLAGLALALVPYAVFTLQYPGKLTRRFRLISYLFKPRFTPAQKLEMFVENYLQTWSPDFLLLSGDPNRRHATGVAGEVYLAVLLLALVGLVWAVRRIRTGDRFALLLLLNLAAAPAAAAMTREVSALRTVLVGLYLVLLSAAGIAGLARLRRPALRRAALMAAALLLAAESGRYLRHYFGPYAEASVWAFRSHDYPGLLATAYGLGARRIEVSWRANAPQAHVQFHALVQPPPSGVEIAMAEFPRAAPGTCAIAFGRRFRVVGERPGLPRRDFGVGDPVRMRCYGMAR